MDRPLVPAGTMQLFAILLATSPAGADAAAPLRTASGAFVHWKAETITVGVGEKLSANLPVASVHLAIREALQAWNVLPGKQPRFAAVTGSASSGRPDVKVEFCTGGWRFAAGLLATTEFKAQVSTGQVSEATILVNECDYKFVGPEEVAEEHFDLQAVITHELGHVLGLGHSTDPAAVMFENTGSVRQRRPTQDDRAGLALIYDPQGTPVASASPSTPAPALLSGGRPANAGPSGGAPEGPAPKPTELRWDDVEYVTAARKPGTARPSDDLLGRGPPGVPLDTAAGVVRTNAAAPAPESSTRPTRRGPRNVPPAEMIHAIKLSTESDLMLYTSDPVILPVFEPLAAPRHRKRSRSAARVRNKQ